MNNPLTASPSAADKIEAYIAEAIASKEQDLEHIQGELSAMREILSTLRAFRMNGIN